MSTHDNDAESGRRRIVMVQLMNTLFRWGPAQLQTALGGSAIGMNGLVGAATAFCCVQHDLASQGSDTSAFESELSTVLPQFACEPVDENAVTHGLARAANELARIQQNRPHAFFQAMSEARQKLYPMLTVAGRPGLRDVIEVMSRHVEGADLFFGSKAFSTTMAGDPDTAIQLFGTDAAAVGHSGGTLSFEQQEAIEWVREELGERVVKGTIVGNNEIAAIIEAYIAADEHTDIKAILLEGEESENAVKVMDILKGISQMASRTMLELLATDAESMHKLESSQADYRRYADLLKERSAFFSPEEMELNADRERYWAKEAAWIANRKKTDRRWSPFQDDCVTLKPAQQEREDVRSLLNCIRDELDPQLKDFLAVMAQEAGLDPDVYTSSRTKGLESALGKLEKLRGQEWAKGQHLSIADLVDLSGGRIVVDDLRDLENVMLAIERLLGEDGDDPRFAGMRILRKENKFIAGEFTTDPYRAIHYIITFPGAHGEQHSFELQIKTLRTMISSDLSHNTWYKPDVLKLPGALHPTVLGYNWQNNIDEARTYLATRAASQSPEEQIAAAVEKRDFNALYDLVLSQIDFSKKSRTFREKGEWIRMYDLANAMLDREIEYLKSVGKANPEIISALAKASHDRGYFLTDGVAGGDGRSGEIYDPQRHKWLAPELSAEARGLLTENGRAYYDDRYETFSGKNKITIGQLDLHRLSLDDLRAFMSAAGKDPDAPALASLIERIHAADEATLKTPIINLYHQSFDDMMRRRDAIDNPEAKQKWYDAVIGNQIKAVALAVLLTEIGGTDSRGNPRDLGERVAPHIPFTIREKLTHEMWVFAIQWNGEYAFDGLDRHGNPHPQGWCGIDGEGRAAMCYEDFVSVKDESGRLTFGDQINFDREIDLAIMRELTMIHLRTIAQQIVSVRSNPVRVAMLQRLKSDILGKYIRAVIPNRRLADALVATLDRLLQQDSDRLLRGESDMQATLGRIVSIATEVQPRPSHNESVLRDAMIFGAATAEYEHAVEMLLPILDVGGFSLRDALLVRDRIYDALQMDLQNGLSDDIELLTSSIPADVPSSAARRIHDATHLARELHRGQRRSERDARPYFLHPLAVAHNLIVQGKVFEVFADDPEKACDMVCAALLHDAKEDVGKGDVGLGLRGQSPSQQREYVDALVRRRLSDNVADMVDALSRPLATPTLDTAMKREAAYQTGLLNASTEEQMIKMADWYTNFSDMINYLRNSREDCVWTARFTRRRFANIMQLMRESQAPLAFKKRVLQHILEEGRRNNVLNRTIPGAEDVESLTARQQRQIESLLKEWEQ